MQISFGSASAQISNAWASRSDHERNRNSNGKEARISSDKSPIAIYVIPLDEELYIARAALRLLDGTAQA